MRSHWAGIELGLSMQACGRKPKLPLCQQEGQGFYSQLAAAIYRLAPPVPIRMEPLGAVLLSDSREKRIKVRCLASA